MKVKILLIPVMLFLENCQSPISNLHNINFIDYLDLQNNSKKFEELRDSEIQELIMNQIVHQINDTLWEFEFKWLRIDSLPISKSVERYSNKDYYKMVSHSYYELDSNGKPLEVHAQNFGENTFKLNDEPVIYDLKYKFQTDPYLTMVIHSENEINHEKIDSLSKHTIFLTNTSKDQFLLDYSDKRKDSTFFVENKRVYEKGKGLILLIQKHENATYIYRLKKQNTASNN